MFAYLDIGGTKTRIAVSPDGAAFEEPIKIETPADFEAGMRAIADAVRALLHGRELRALGGGIAGRLDERRGTLLRAPHLTGWLNKPLAETLSTNLGVPIFLENDSAVVALGEAHHGAGQGYPLVAYLTVSTGVGGARIVHGKIDVSSVGFEPGHQYIDLDTSLYPDAERGEAELYLSGSAVEKRFGCKPYEIKEQSFWDEMARQLAYAVTNTIVYWSPHVVVLGGSMIVGNPAIPVGRVREHVGTLCTIFPTLPEIKEASLEDFGGLYGALELVKQKMAQ